MLVREKALFARQSSGVLTCSETSAACGKLRGRQYGSYTSGDLNMRPLDPIAMFITTTV